MRFLSVVSRCMAVAATFCAVASGHAHAGNGQATLIGWNNLGMHCMDDDYSVFSILPPYNVIDAHFIDASGHLVTTGAGVIVTFEGVADPDGSINTTAIGKTTFWEYSPALFGAALPLDLGLPFPAGNPGVQMPGMPNTPQLLTFVPGLNWFEAAGIPITPFDNAGHGNSYPLLRLVAKGPSGTVLAQTDVVAPVSVEMDCRKCHGSGSGPDALPAGGWVYDAHPSRDYRLNILRLHDEKHLGAEPYTGALAARGYPAGGLEASVRDHDNPVLCAACHASEALGAPSYPGVKSLTASMHGMHAHAVDPDNGMILDNATNRSACYTCHPGSTTRCLRGAMGSAVASDGTLAMQCQSCHGTMSQVGAITRTGWLDEPSCQQCHTGSATQNNGQIRYTTVFESDGVTPRVPANALFATNANTPLPGKSLYRFSKGHGGLQCSACHGSTHAEYPASHRNDNIQSNNLQGHAGMLVDCLACHATMPNTVNGGPHGMHPISNNWITDHHDLIEQVGLGTCRSCHGSNYRGTVLSRAQGDRTFNTKYGAKTFYRGRTVGCYDCHNGIDTDSATSHSAPTVSNTTLNIPPGASSGSIGLGVTGTGTTVRIVQQPAHGTVALSGLVATYYPNEGFTGPDMFTFAGRDSGNYVDSANLGVVSVNVGDAAVISAQDTDGDGLTDLIEYALGLSLDFPSISPVNAPVLETVGGQTYLTLSIPLFFPPTDVTLTVEVSSDLANWQPATVVASNATLLLVRDPLPAANYPRRFIRLRVSR